MTPRRCARSEAGPGAGLARDAGRRGRRTPSSATSSRTTVASPGRAVPKLLRREEVEDLDQLTHRERKVLELRFGLRGEEPRTLEEVGQRFGVTRERIRQIEAKTLTKLQGYRDTQRLREFMDEPPAGGAAIRATASARRVASVHLQGAAGRRGRGRSSSARGRRAAGPIQPISGAVTEEAPRAGPTPAGARWARAPALTPSGRPPRRHVGAMGRDARRPARGRRARPRGRGRGRGRRARGGRPPRPLPARVRPLREPRELVAQALCRAASAATRSSGSIPAISSSSVGGGRG